MGVAGFLLGTSILFGSAAYGGEREYTYFGTQDMNKLFEIPESNVYGKNLGWNLYDSSNEPKDRMDRIFPKRLNYDFTLMEEDFRISIGKSRSSRAISNGLGLKMTKPLLDLTYRFN